MFEINLYHVSATSPTSTGSETSSSSVETIIFLVRTSVTPVFGAPYLSTVAPDTPVLLSILSMASASLLLFDLIAIERLPTGLPFSISIS